MKHLQIKMRAALLAMLGIVCFASAPPVAFGGWVGETMCACPGMSKPLGNNATCEDACYGTRSTPSGGSSGSTSGGLPLGQELGKALGQALGQEIGKALFGDPEADARRKGEEDARAAQAAEEQRRQEEETLKRHEEMKNRLLGGMLNVGESSQLGLMGADSGSGLSLMLGDQPVSPSTSSDKANQKADHAGMPAMPASVLPSGDPMVVDARNVPSGLPKGLDNAIATAYADAPPGVSDRVRKGFQAVMVRDWKVAKAWFQDALNRDPNNVGLKRLVALTDTSQQPNKQSATVDERNEPAGLGGKSGLKGEFATPSQTKPAPTTDPNLVLPDPNDIRFLFPGFQAMEDKQALDYLFGLDP